jgi:hypothetical protein
LISKRAMNQTAYLSQPCLHSTLHSSCVSLPKKNKPGRIFAPFALG